MNMQTVEKELLENGFAIYSLFDKTVPNISDLEFLNSALYRNIISNIHFEIFPTYVSKYVAKTPALYQNDNFLYVENNCLEDKLVLDVLTVGDDGKIDSSIVLTNVNDEDTPVSEIERLSIKDQPSFQDMMFHIDNEEDETDLSL